MNMAQKKKLHIGLLGFGSMGKTHTWAIQNLPFFYGELPFHAEVYGVCTTSQEKSKKIATDFGFRLAASDENQLIQCSDVDIIDICTPNIFHFETLQKAILAGKHVLCEKPLCVNTQQTQALLALPRRDGQIIGTVFHNRRIAPVIRAKELIEEGRIGKILNFRAAYFHNSAMDKNKPAGWKQDRTVCGGGVLFDLGSHVIDLVSYLCGTITHVSGMSQIAFSDRTGRDGKPWQTNADESFYMMCQTAGGAYGTLSVGKLQIGTNDDLSFEIYGEHGALRFSLMEPNWLYFYDGTRPDAPIGGERGFTRIECVGRYPDMVFPSSKAPAGWLYGHLVNMHDFLIAVANEKPFAPSLEDGAYVQAVMDAAYRSDANRGILTEV